MGHTHSCYFSATTGSWLATAATMTGRHPTVSKPPAVCPLGGRPEQTKGDGPHAATQLPGTSAGSRADVRIIQALLSHARLASTARYAQVATKIISTAPSPLDPLRREIVPARLSGRKAADAFRRHGEETFTTAAGRRLAFALALSSARAAQIIWYGTYGVDGIDSLKILRGKPVEIVIRHLGSASIVDQHVEPPPGRGSRDNIPAILIARNITLLRHDFSIARLAAPFGSSLGFFLAFGIVDHDARAALAKRPAVAAPILDAEPVTVAHNPSFHIVRSLSIQAAWYWRTHWQKPRKVVKPITRK